MTSHYLDRIAAFAKELRLSDLPPDVVERAQWLLLDGIAVIVAGSVETRVANLARMLEAGGSQGKSLFMVDGVRGDAAHAALVNGTASCAHVLDEGHKYARGHVGTYVLPSVLAMAEEREVSCNDMLVAMVAAYEIAARMGIACRVHETMHPSGTWGTIGAAAGVARLMGFDVAQIRAAMNVAAPLTLATSWQAATQGATVRDLYSGVGAGNGVLAPRYVAAGFTGSDDDVSHVLGKVVSKAFDKEAAAAELGSRWEVMRNYFKVHACCRNFQSAIDAALTLIEREKVAAADIVDVRVDTFEVPARDNAETEPVNVPAAKESLPVSLALTLVERRCDQAVFTEANVAKPDVGRLARATKVVCDPELDALAPERRPSRVTLRLRDGRSVSDYWEVALGDPLRPLTPQMLEDKFDALVGARLGASRADAIKELVRAMRPGTTMRDLSRLLESET